MAPLAEELERLIGKVDALDPGPKTSHYRDGDRTERPWQLPELNENDPYGRNCPVDHEGCGCWPWFSIEEAELAYFLVNNSPAILTALKAGQP